MQQVIVKNDNTKGQDTIARQIIDKKVQARMYRKEKIVNANKYMCTQLNLLPHPFIKEGGAQGFPKRGGSEFFHKNEGFIKQGNYLKKGGSHEH